jgi:hypothetical protein
MAFLNRSNPYDPHYAIPKYVQGEPLGRGTLTTRWAQRGTIPIYRKAVRPWRPKYALPKIVRKEVPGMGVHVTKMLPRGTIPGKIPSEFVSSKKAGVTVTPMGLGSCGAACEPLANNQGYSGAIPGFDPIKEYGKQASAYLMKTIKGVPRDEQGIAMRAVLDTLEPGLWRRVQSKARQYRKAGKSKPMQKALAESLSEGFGKEIVKIGRGAPPKKVSLSGLGFYEDAKDVATYKAIEKMEALGLFNPFKAIADAGKAVGGAVWSAGKTVVSAPKWAAGKVWDGTKWVGQNIWTGTKKAVGWVGDAVGKLADVACKVIGHPAAPVAGGAAAAAYGAPPQAGAGGVAVAQQICAKEGPYPPPPPPSRPAWLWPAVIGGGVLVVVLATRK